MKKVTAGLVWLFAGLGGTQSLLAQNVVEVPGDYATIQAALDAVKANPSLSSTIEIAPDTYTENLIISSPITLQGMETARTIINPERAEKATIVVLNTANVTLRNLTFDEGEIALDVANSSQVTVTNNVFALDDQALAARFDVTSTADVQFNVFYGNATALERANVNVVANYNIFAENALAIEGAGANVAYNCFDNNTADGVSGVSPVLDEDPLFVAVDNLDFHLKEGSPCIDAGGSEIDTFDDSTADVGAYGGEHADMTPFPVQGVTAQKVASANEITVSWQKNQSYLVTHSSAPGGYLLYYDTDKAGEPYSGTGAAGGTKASPIDVGNVETYTLTDLTVDSAVPLAPVIGSAQPANEQVSINWSAVSGASGYTLYYGIDDVEEHSVEVGTGREYTVSGLENGVVYQFAVRARAQAQYFIALRAYDSTTAENKSVYSSAKTVTMGSLRIGDLSAIVTAMPEAVEPIPNLPDEGCFIATAAFGFYSAAQVEWLREFRDVHLKRFILGRWFVKLYYTYSPVLAEQIRHSVYWQNVVRIALSPLIMLAALLINGVTLVLMLIGVLVGVIFMRQRRMSQIKEAVR